MFFPALYTIIEIAPAAGSLLVYFPLPRFMTFGHKVGGVLPLSCEASVRYKGLDGVQCLASRLLDPLTDFGGDEAWGPGRIELPVGVVYSLLVIASVPPLAVVVLLVCKSRLDHWDEACDLQKRLEEQEIRKGEKTDDFFEDSGKAELEAA